MFPSTAESCYTVFLNGDNQLESAALSHELSDWKQGGASDTSIPEVSAVKGPSAVHVWRLHAQGLVGPGLLEISCA